MPKHGHHRSSLNEFLLFNPYTDVGWRVVRRIGFHRGERMVDLGAAVKVLDDFGNHVGYKLRGSSEPGTPVVEASGSTSIALDARESMANAGLFGGSRTESMSEERKLSRIHPRSGRFLAPEDMVERAQGKVRVYQTIGGIQDVIVKKQVAQM